jgi:hypothetical protein
MATQNRVTEIDDGNKPAARSTRPAATGLGGDINFPAQFRSEPRKRVLVHSTSDTDGDKPVVLGIQGHVIRFPRDREYALPLSFVEALRDITIGAVDKETGERFERMRYPHTVLGDAPSPVEKQAA